MNENKLLELFIISNGDDTFNTRLVLKHTDNTIATINFEKVKLDKIDVISTELLPYFIKNSFSKSSMVTRQQESVKKEIDIFCQQNISDIVDLESNASGMNEFLDAISKR